MKKLNSLLMAALFGGALMFSVTSCKDECKDVTCENGGTCEEGVCSCAANFEGDLCEDAFSDKFVGTYNGDDDCGFDYQSQVTKSDENTIMISNFAGTNTTATAEVTESSSITIASQTNGGYTYSGSGSISGTTLTIDYSITLAGATENCTITYTR